MRRTALAWLILPAVVLLPTLGALHGARLPGSVAAQTGAAVALTGATVVVGNGQIISDGTVL
ncbi:MAG: hypothetical protein IMZ67_02515, partial [Acidobacteria bacterium]|nr:hypothetical protein [Acidobacteriota bacterium]